MAASSALPPARRAATPDSAARRWGAATMPRAERASGQRVRMAGAAGGRALMLGSLYFTGGPPMGAIVYAAAMSHVLYPDYYGKNVGPHGRRMVEALIAEVQAMGAALRAARPDALVVVADDHLNVFSYDAVPALCVRVGRSVDRMVQADAIEFDRALDGLPARYPLHEDLAARVLEQGIEDGFDLAASWSAPLDHAFLSPVGALCGTSAAPPLVPF